MSFLDDMRLHDLALLETLDGRVVTYTPDGGSSRVLSGMLQAFSELVGGETIDVVVNQPVLSLRTIDIPEIAVGDQFEIDTQTYEVAVIKPDSEGISELFLEKM